MDLLQCPEDDVILVKMSLFLPWIDSFGLLFVGLVGNGVAKQNLLFEGGLFGFFLFYLLIVVPPSLLKKYPFRWCIGRLTERSPLLGGSFLKKP